MQHTGRERAERRADVDWLRILAVQLLFFWHAAMAFGLHPWHVKYAAPSIGWNVFLDVVHQLHMPLFFALAGWSLCASLARRSAGQVVVDRASRLLVPFVFGVLVLSPPQGYVEFLTLRGGSGSFASFVPHFFGGLEHFDWHHFWFLIYLAVFTALYGPALAHWARRTPSGVGGRRLLYLALIPLVAVQIGLRWRWPGVMNLYDDWANFAYYSLFFLGGFAIARLPAIEDAIHAERRRLASVFVLAVVMLFVADRDVGIPMPDALAYALYWAASGVAGFTGVGAALGLARGLRWPTGRVFRYLREAAFPIYMLHQVAIILLAWWSFTLPLAAGPAYALLVIGSAALSYAAYHLLVRPLAPARFLFGMPPRRRRAAQRPEWTAAGPFPTDTAAATSAGPSTYRNEGREASSIVSQARSAVTHRFDTLRRRWFLRVPEAFPLAGLALAFGLLASDAIFAVRGFLTEIRADGLWRELMPALGMYLAFCVVIDAGARRLLPRSLRSRHALRGAIVVSTGLGLCLASGESRSLLIFAPTVAFAALACGRYTWPVAVAVLVFAMLPTLGGSGRTAPSAAAVTNASGPSIAVIVLDTVRWDRTSTYGYGRPTTPHLSALAERGVRFERAYSTGCWSLPSHASIFTGLYPAKHGAHHEHLALPADAPTLAEVLAESGYETVLFSGNPWLSRGTGMARGFDRVHDAWRTYQMRWYLLAWRIVDGIVARERDKGGGWTIAGIERWLAERDASRPYLMVVNLFEAHPPFQEVPLAFRSRFAKADLSLIEMERIGMTSSQTTKGEVPLPEHIPTIGDLMDGAVAAVDDYLGRILDAVGEETLVVVVSDHGELLGEQSLFGHHNTLFEPLIRIPMVMAGASLPRRVVVEAPVTLADVMPTLLAAAGVVSPPTDGIDLARLLPGGDAPDRVVAAEQFRPTGLAASWRELHPERVEALFARKRAVIGSEEKRIVGEDGSDVLFDLARDPGELAPRPGGASRLAATPPGPPAHQGGAELAADERAALERLGYLQ